MRRVGDNGPTEGLVRCRGKLFSKTYSIRLPSHVQPATLELGEGVGEDGEEGCDVNSRFLGGPLGNRSARSQTA
jgi:hypothetical protein